MVNFHIVTKLKNVMAYVFQPFKFHNIVINGCSKWAKVAIQRVRLDFSSLELRVTIWISLKPQSRHQGVVPYTHVELSFAIPELLFFKAFFHVGELFLSLGSSKILRTKVEKHKD
jgi:hypothetical protein